MVGMPPLNRKRLAGPVLDSRDAKTIADVDALLERQPIGVQLATDGWKRKNVNEAQKVQNFMANFPDGGSSFLTAHGTDGCTMDNHEYERILTEQIVALGERLGSINKVLGCITDREAAVQLAFDRLETKYHWLVNLVCQALGFSLLIKDLLKEFLPMGNTVEISNFEGNHAWFRRLLHEFRKAVYGHNLEIAAQVERRFETKVMVCQSIMCSAEALRKVVMDERYTSAAASNSTAETIHDLRFRKCYHPAMSAAYLCDAAFYTFDAESEAYTANEQRISDMAAHLKIDVWADATKVIQRIAGRPLMGKATIEMTTLHVNGLQDKDLGVELVQTLPSDVPGRSLFVKSIKVRRAVWGSQATMGKEYPAISPIAGQLLSLHATSCAPGTGLYGANYTAKTEVAWPCQGLRSSLQ
ncbi:hypothetical protein WJX77_000286 [Trebouxia sp. C0004]